MCFKNCLKNFSKSGLRQLQKRSVIRCQSHCPLVKSIRQLHAVSKIVKFVSKIVSKTASKTLKDCHQATAKWSAIRCFKNCKFYFNVYFQWNFPSNLLQEKCAWVSSGTTVPSIWIVAEGPAINLTRSMRLDTEIILLWLVLKTSVTSWLTMNTAGKF